MKIYIIYVLIISSICAININEEVRVNVELGIVLKKKGYVVDNSNAVFVSTFIKVQDPLYNINMCNLGCDNALDDMISSNIRAKSGCVNIGKTGQSNLTVLKTVRTKKPTLNTRKGAQNQCIRACLRETQCKAFGYQETAKGALCFLRANKLEGSQLQDWSQGPSMEGTTDCLVDNDRRGFCEKAMNKNNIARLLYRENVKFVNDSWTRLNTLVEENPDNRREKRQALGFLFGGILAAGFSTYETYRLKEHVTAMENKFREFEKQQAKFDKEVIDFEGSILKIYQNLENELKVEIDGLECDIKNLAFQMLNSGRLATWKLYLDTMYQDIISGSMEGNVSPLIYSQGNVREILKNVPSLNDTIYGEDYRNIYRFAKMHVTDKSRAGDHFNVHVVLKIPILRKSHMMPLFEILQSGVFYGKLCAVMELPLIAFSRGDRYFGLKDALCSKTSGITMCLSRLNQTAEKLPCLTDRQTCVTKIEMCSDRIIETTAGVLVRAEGEIHAIKTQEKNVFVRINKTKYNTVFLPYPEYYEVEVNKRVVRSLEYPTLIKLISLENTDKWFEELSKKTISLSKQNLTEISNIIDQQMSLYEQLNSLPLRIIHEKLWWVAPLALIILVTLHCCSCFMVTKVAI